MIKDSKVVAVRASLSISELKEGHGALLDVLGEMISPAATAFIMALAQDIQQEMLSRAVKDADLAAKVWRHTHDN